MAGLPVGERLILEAWEEGFDLHAHGLHEHALDPEDVEQRLPVIERLVEYTKKRLSGVERGSA